jgi:hypothetical protein
MSGKGGYLHSKGFKTIMKHFFGWGAAIVIIGALFGILSYFLFEYIRHKGIENKGTEYKGTENKGTENKEI